jgi:regulation of enolase protein 1 (concanavalin A-like superfamily)
MGDRHADSQPVPEGAGNAGRAGMDMLLSTSVDEGGAMLRWLNEPRAWSFSGGVLAVTADAATDFWRTTHYGYDRGTGHVYGELIAGDATVGARVEGAYADQYDQAGLMIWIDERNWLKAGIEFYEGQLRLSTVVTVDYSNWSLSTLPPDLRAIWLRMERQRETVKIHYSVDGDSYQLAALVYLPPDREALAGVMCAAPDGNGFRTTFTDLTVGRPSG